MDNKKWELVQDSMYFLSVVLISFGVGLNWQEMADTGFWSRPILYSVFLVFAYKMMVYNRWKD